MNTLERSMDPHITACLLRARSGDVDAFATLFTYYIERLRGFVNTRLSGRDRAGRMDDDISLETMSCLWTDLNGGRFAKVVDLEELWYVIMRIAQSRLIDRRRYCSRIRRAWTRTFAVEILGVPKITPNLVRLRKLDLEGTRECTFLVRSESKEKNWKAVFFRCAIGSGPSKTRMVQDQ